MKCLGCKLANQKDTVHVIFENEQITCLLDHNPYNEGHVLILPKGHVRELSELPIQIANTIMEVSQLLSLVLEKAFQPDGMTVMQNGGHFNDLDHYHLHLIPRYKGQSFSTFFEEEVLNEHPPLHETKVKLVRILKQME
ncbi:HIT family protein [Halobacillus salinus]|uniref:HIT family protein n=1 Tax=Halobacillus salinus TaxID=192814 RepID=UPI0009A586E1|nr:HIT family protein [Halobacillus salinus]